MVMTGLQHIQKNIQLPVQFIQLAVDILHLHEGFHLPGNAAHVFSAQHMSRVGAVLDISLVQPSHNTAGVVTHMGITHSSRIGAVIDLAVADPRDTARIHMSIQLGAGRCLLQILHGEIFQIIDHIVGVNIDATLVGAVVQDAVVASGDAAAAAVAQHCHIGRAAADLAAGLVDARNASHFLLAFQHAGNLTIHDAAIIPAHKNARLAAAALGQYLGLGNHQILNHRPLLQIAEQSHPGTRLLNRQAADGVTLAVKYPAEYRDHQFCAGQIQIRLQQHPLIP